MKLNKKTILSVTALEFTLMVLSFIVFTLKSSEQLIISELLFIAFISAVAAFNINVLFIVLYKMIKTVTEKQ